MGAFRKCLVTGATGAVGPALVHHLIEQGYLVRVLCRDGSDTSCLPKGLSYVVGDINDFMVLQESVKDIDIIFHLAAKLHVNDPTLVTEKEIFNVNVGGTKKLVAASAESNVSRLIFFSTINVYLPTDDGSIRNETSKIKGQNIYTESKILAEEIVLKARRGNDGKTFGTVLRLAAVYGPNMKGNYTRVIKGVSKGWFYPIGKCINRRTLISDLDVARAALITAKSPKTMSEVYNVTDGHIYYLKEIYDAIWRGLGKKPPKVHIPFFPIRFAVIVFQSVCGIIGKNPPISINMLNKMMEDRAVSGNKFINDLDFIPEITLKDGWKRAVKGIVK